MPAHRIAFLAALAGCTGEGREFDDPICRSTLAVRADGAAIGDPPCGELDLTARAIGDGDLRLGLDLDAGRVKVRVSSDAGGTLRGVVFEGDATVEGDGALVYWKQGYQSWSWSGVTTPGELELDADGLPVTVGDDLTLAANEQAGASWWAGLLGRSGGGSLLIGAVGSSRMRFVIGADADGHVVGGYGGHGEAIELAAGESVELDPLFLGLGRDPNELWSAYADAVAAEVAPRPLGEAAPVGWGSWYQYYADVDEQHIRDNATAAAALDAGLEPISVIVVDDGWERAWGDWTADDGFPSGTATLAADLQAQGFVPGLWMAPFFVDRSTPAYLDHPDWWVLGDDGEELTYSNLGTGDYAVLDVTVPEAADWLGEQVASKRAEGWRFFKLDFLYAGAVEGVRSRPVTGIEAYHLGMQILRESAGDAFVLASGAPMLPTVGYAEGFRTGADVAFTVAPDPDVAFGRWAARATAGRGFANGLWWWNDPDQILVRDPLTDPQVDGVLAANVAAGGLWLLGDDLTALDSGRLAKALDPALLAARGRPRPQDPLAFVSGVDAGPPVELIQPDDVVPTSWSLGGTIVLLNHGTAPIELLAPPGRELLGGSVSGDGQIRTLEPGAGEVWSISR